MTSFPDQSPASILCPASIRAAGTSCRGHSLEVLEARIAPAVVSVASIARAAGAAVNTASGSVDFSVSFSEEVSGVDQADFLVHTEGSAHADSAVTIAAVSPSLYTVTVTGLHGQGDVRLDLVDNDSIAGASGQLGGAGLANGSFTGASYHLLHVFPKVTSVAAVGSTHTSADSVSWTVTTSTAVTGIDPTDFILRMGPGVSADAAVTVTGSGTTYLVTAAGVRGAGSLTLELVDDGTIQDTYGNPLQGTPPPAFAAQESPATGLRPFSVAVADLNGDGQSDVVTANYGSNSLRVLLGNGSGGFTQQPSPATNSHPVAIVAADVNGDGRPDLVVANKGSNNVSVLLGNGSGGFTAQPSPATGSSPYSVAVADVNGDGRPDLVTANYLGNNVSVLLGNGSGGFTARPTIATGVHPRSVAVGDLNGDGRADLVTANYGSNTVSVLLGNGNGGFTAQPVVATGSFPRSVAIADLNGDGRPDIVTANGGSSDVSVLLGTGSGRFTAQPAVAAGSTPFSVAVGDLNGDGKLDLAVADFVINKLHVLLGNGSGGFAAQPTLSTGSGPLAVAVSDVDGDGRPDLVTANHSGDTLSVWLGAGRVNSFTGDTFTIREITSLTHAGPPTITGTSAAWTLTFNTDVTGVDPTDFATVTTGTAKAGAISVTPVSDRVYTVAVDGLSGSGDVQLSLIDDDSIAHAIPLGGPGLSNGSFQGDAVHLRQTFPTKVKSITAVGSTTSYASSVSWTVTLSAPVTGLDATDFTLLKTGVRADPEVTVTGSGATYTVTATGVSGTGTLALQLLDDRTIVDASGLPLQGTAPLTFAPQASPGTGSAPHAVVVADVNGDGSPDLVTANSGSNTASVLFGNGRGEFPSRVTVGTGSRPYSVAVGDLNGDGRPDLVTANSTGDNVSVLLADGNGGFAAQAPVATGSRPLWVAIADLNGDGKPDLVTANERSSTVSVLLGNGLGEFIAQPSVSTGASPRSVAIADVNGDGQPDLVTANLAGRSASVLLNDGNGGFTAQRPVFLANSPFALEVGDVNGDGRPDLVTAELFSNTATVLLGKASGGFLTQPALATGGRPYSVEIGDLNGDGKPDLVAANFESGDVSVLLGDGDGGFTAQPTVPTGSGPFSVAMSDLNGDGLADLVTANLHANNVTVLLGAGAFTGETFFLNPFTVDAKHPLTFFDRNHDKVTVKLTGPGAGTLLLEGGLLDGADISHIHLSNAAKSSLSVTVVKDKNTGDGLVGLGEVIVDGALQGFSGPAVDFTGSGLHATGAVRAITAHDLLRGEIFSLGSPADLLTLTLSQVADGALIQSGGTIALTARQIGAAKLQAGAFSAINVTSGALNAAVTSAGAIAKIAINGGGQAGVITAASFGPVSIKGGDFSGTLTSLATAEALGKTPALASLTLGPGSSLTGTLDALGAAGGITVQGYFGGVLTAASFGPVSVTGGDFAGTLNSLATAEALGKTPALASLIINGGALQGHVNALGAAGTIAVKGVYFGGKLTAGSFGALSVTAGDFLATLAATATPSALGKTPAVKSLTVTGALVAGVPQGGTFGGRLEAMGAVGAITIRGGTGLTGDLSAASFGAVSLTGGADGGDLSGRLISTGSPATLGITRGIASLSLTHGNLTGHVEASGAVGAITVKAGSVLGELTAASFGAISVTDGDFGGRLTSATAPGTLLKIPALASLTVTRGSVAAVIDVLGAVGAVTVRAGAFGAFLSAGSIGAVSVSGGDFNGVITSLTPATTLGQTLALKSLMITGGDLAGYVRLLGAAGPISVQGAGHGPGGNVIGASIVASAIGSLTVAKELISSTVLAGADLGTDYMLGYGNDVFAGGHIGAVRISGNVSGGSVIAAGLSSSNDTFRDSDDIILGGSASVIQSFSIAGSIGDSYFAAGRFATAPVLAGEKVVLPDPRFKVAP